jgi:phage terminase small subunit
MRNQLSRKYSKLDIKHIREYLSKNNIQIDQEKEFKLNLLSDLIEDYKDCLYNIKENGLIITTNGNKTTCLNPCIKLKISCIKLIIKLLQEIGIKSETIINDDSEDFINSLLSE